MAVNQPAGRHAHVCPWKHLRCSLSLLPATEDALGGTRRPNLVLAAHCLLNGVHGLCIRFQNQPVKEAEQKTVWKQQVLGACLKCRKA